MRSRDAAQPHHVAGDRERDDLPPTVGQQLIAAGPTRLENEGLVAGLPFLRELPAPLHFEGIRLQVRQARQLVGRQGHERIQLPGQDAIELRIGHEDLLVNRDPAPLQLGCAASVEVTTGRCSMV